MSDNLFTQRKPLMEIIEIPQKVTSVYSMVQHIWDGETDATRQKSRKNGKIREATLEEYFLDPVRSYLERFMQDVADGEGQGYWLLAHFGVGKSHLMAVESVLALGGDEVWDIVKRKEDEVKNLGPAARLDRFRGSVGPKKIFPIIFTLEGKGGGTTENRLVDFVLAEAANLYELRTGKPLAVTPGHHLVDWYLGKGRSHFEGALKAFVANKQAMENLPKFDNYTSLLSALQDPDSVEDAAMVLRGFLRSQDIRVDTRTEPAELLKHAFQHILDSGYNGILVVIDEMSEYMNKTRYPADDEDCLLTLSSVLAKGEKMPIWTIVAAQAQYQKQDKIVGQDRMREELLDHKPERFRNIVVNRCRQYRVLKGKSQAPETHNYYLGYKETIPWVKASEEEAFRDSFPFPPEAIQVIQAISQKLTGTRSTIAFLHAALRRIRDHETQWNELVPLYRIFAELLDYAENPSNSDSGSLSVKSVSEFRDGIAALESAKKKLSKTETGQLGKKAGKRRGERILVTLFLYRIAGWGGLTTAQILDAVSDLKGEDGLDIQLDYYESLLKELKTELRGQIREADGKFEFVPKETGEFDDVVQQVVERLKTDSVVFWSYFDKLLEYSQDAYKSPFSDYRGNSLVRLDIVWHGQKRVGHVCFRDLSIKGGQPPRIETATNEADFVTVLSRRPVKDTVGRDYLKSADPKNPDPRAILWVPAELTDDQKTSLINVLAYLKVEEDYPGTKYAKDARASFQLHCQTAYDLLRQLYEQGKARTTRKTLTVDWTGGLDGALERLATDTLDECYRAAEIDTKPRNFGTDEAVKLINGLVKLGQSVPVNDSLHSAVDNFAGPLKLVRAPHLDRLDPTTSDAFQEIRTFAEGKAGHPVLMSVFYNQFTGWRPEDGAKSWGLTRRMVDIYLIAMAQMGVVRINLKKGDPIDRNSVQGTDFRPDTLRSFETVELPRALLDWDRVSPFLEIIAAASKGEYGPKYDQVTARRALDKLRGAWVSSDRIESLLTRVSELFRGLNQKDPYDELLQFWMEFFSDALPTGSDTDVFEFFKAALLKAFNRESAEEFTAADEVSFGSNWRQLQALQEHFDDQAVLVRCAGSYAQLKVPEVNEYKPLTRAVSALPPLVIRAKEFLVDPDLTNAQLRPALEAVWKEHDGPFLHGVHGVNEALSDLKTNVELVKTSPEFKAVSVLSAAVPEAKLALNVAQKELATASAAIISPLPSGDECKRRLRSRASISLSDGTEIHLKDLRPFREELQAKADSCAGVPAEALLRVARFLCEAQVRAKLQVHADKQVVAGMLAVMLPEGVAQYLLKITKEEMEELAKILSAVLTGIEFQTILLSDFKPTRSVIWSEDEVPAVVGEFESFLRSKTKGKVVKIV